MCHTYRTMGRRIALLLLACVTVGCGASAAELRRAKRSAYKTSFAKVWQVVTEEVGKRNPELDTENPEIGVVRTGWKLVERRETDDINSENELYVGGVFMRYKVRIHKNGPPWRISVDAEAAAYRPGLAMIQPFSHSSPDEPTYVRARINALHLDIDRKLRGYAIEMRDPSEDAPVYDTARWTGLPPAAAQVIAMSHDAAKKRDAAALRAVMAHEFRWSLGAERSVDQAVSVYSADPDLLKAMEKVLAAGCGEDPATHTIACPAGATEEGEGARAGFQEVGGVWRMTWFLGAR
jgi:hypothetical protein